MKVATPMPGTTFQHYVSEDQTINAAMGILAGRMKNGTRLTSPEDAKKYLRLQMAGLPYETFWGVYMDIGYRVVAAEELFRGTNTQTPVYVREVAKRALELNASYLIVAHNHPSGHASPSREDKNMTLNLAVALLPLDVTLIDHYIVTDEDVFSFQEGGVMDELAGAISRGNRDRGFSLEGLARHIFGMEDIAADLMAHIGAAFKAPVPVQDMETLEVEDRAGREAFRRMVEGVIQR